VSEAERRRKISEASRKQWQDPEIRRKRIEGIHAKRNSISESMKANWRDPVFAEQQKKALKASPNPGGRSEKLARWADPERNAEISAKIRAGRGTEEQRRKTREHSKAIWCDPELVKRMTRTTQINIPEGKLLKIIEPLGFRYSGSGKHSLIINGKRPDFWNGNTRVVDLYGCYWHSCPTCFLNKGKNPENVQERQEEFSLYGYESVIIWEHEVEDVEATLSKVLSAFQK